MAAGDCGRDEGEREKDDGGVDEGVEDLGEDWPDEGGLEPGVREPPPSSCGAAHSDGCRRRGCATCPSLATGSRATIPAAPPAPDGLSCLRRGGIGGTAGGEGVSVAESGGADAAPGDCAAPGGVAGSSAGSEGEEAGTPGELWLLSCDPALQAAA